MKIHCSNLTSNNPFCFSGSTMFLKRVNSSKIFLKNEASRRPLEKPLHGACKRWKEIYFFSYYFLFLFIICYLVLLLIWYLDMPYNCFLGRKWPMVPLTGGIVVIFQSKWRLKNNVTLEWFLNTFSLLFTQNQ